MRSRHGFIFLFFFLSLVFSGPHLLAFSSPNVPIDDPVYRDIDKLVGAGLVKDVIYGQRPWSRSEIARMIASAIRNEETFGQPVAPEADELSYRLYIQEIINRLKKDYREELSEQKIILHPLEELQFDYTLLDSPYRRVPENNGLGAIDAFINPLVAYQEGRHYVDGNTIGLETTHRAQLTRYFSLYARPRFEILMPNTGSADVNPIVQQLYGKAGYRNFELEIGRDSIEWGQGEFGGILLSNNARPLDMIKLSNPSPLILPWIFRYIGPLKGTVFVSNLGPEREFPYSTLVGAKLSLKPVSFFEIGAAQTVVMGGRGAPGPLTFGNIIQELIGARINPYSGTNLSNREMGFDFRFWLPFLRNTQVYLDMQIEDGSSQPSFLFTELTSYHAGIYVPRLWKDGNTDLRLEYRHGSPFFYKHGGFTTGMSLNGRIWGDELGPQSDGIYMSLSHARSEKLMLSSSFHYERRGGNILSQISNADTRQVITITPMPAENRYLWKIKGDYAFNQTLNLALELGYERANSFNFTTGDNRNNFLGRLGLRFHLF